jgi:hypothetical protein
MGGVSLEADTGQAACPVGRTARAEGPGPPAKWLLAILAFSDIYMIMGVPGAVLAPCHVETPNPEPTLGLRSSGGHA